MLANGYVILAKEFRKVVQYDEKKAQCAFVHDANTVRQLRTLRLQDVGVRPRSDEAPKAEQVKEQNMHKWPALFPRSQKLWHKVIGGDQINPGRTKMREPSRLHFMQRVRKEGENLENRSLLCRHRDIPYSKVVNQVGEESKVRSLVERCGRCLLLVMANRLLS